MDQYIMGGGVIRPFWHSTAHKGTWKMNAIPLPPVIPTSVIFPQTSLVVIFLTAILKAKSPIFQIWRNNFPFNLCKHSGSLNSERQFGRVNLSWPKKDDLPFRIAVWKITTRNIWGGGKWLAGKRLGESMGGGNDWEKRTFTEKWWPFTYYVMTEGREGAWKWLRYMSLYKI